MPPSLVKWLDHAFVSGTGAQGSLLLFGPLRKFPFIKNDGQFIVDSNIHDLKFNYLPDWANIDHTSGNLVFYQTSNAFLRYKKVVLLSKK